MTLAINAVYHGFKVLQAQFVDEISSQAYIMEHIKSGARLLYLANDDDNKVFSISFRTPPADDTGVAHILSIPLLRLPQISLKGALRRPRQGFSEHLFERYDLPG